MKDFTIEATLENMPAAAEFISAELEAADCPMKILMQMDIAADEILSNIVYYAYGDKTGPATVSVGLLDDGKTYRVVFIDSGRPYDPLKREDPDITLSAEERDIGGLGIFMVKKTMDNVYYEYKDGKNILTIEKAKA